MSTPFAKISGLCRSLAAVTMALLVVPGTGGAAEPPASAPSGSTLAAALSASAPVARLYVRDGQVASHIFSVMVTDAVTESMKPKLFLTGSHWVQKRTRSTRSSSHRARAER